MVVHMVDLKCNDLNLSTLSWGQILQVRTYKVAEDILDFLELALEAAKGPEETALGET